MCLLSSVFCRLLLLLKLCLCPLNLSLNSFFASPMCVLASSLPSRVVTDALYITDITKSVIHKIIFRSVFYRQISEKLNLVCDV